MAVAAAAANAAAMEAEAQAKAEAEARAKAEAEARARMEAEMHEAEARAKAEARAREKAEAAATARLAEAEQARLDLEEARAAAARTRQEAEARAEAEAEARVEVSAARLEAEQARQEAARARKEADEVARLLAEQRAAAQAERAALEAQLAAAEERARAVRQAGVSETASVRAELQAAAAAAQAEWEAAAAQAAEEARMAERQRWQASESALRREMATIVEDQAAALAAAEARVASASDALALHAELQARAAAAEQGRVRLMEANRELTGELALTDAKLAAAEAKRAVAERAAAKNSRDGACPGTSSPTLTPACGAAEATDQAAMTSAYLALRSDMQAMAAAHAAALSEAEERVDAAADAQAKAVDAAAEAKRGEAKAVEESRKLTELLSAAEARLAALASSKQRKAPTRHPDVRQAAPSTAVEALEVAKRTASAMTVGSARARASGEVGAQASAAALTAVAESTAAASVGPSDRLHSHHEAAQRSAAGSAGQPSSRVVSSREESPDGELPAHASATKVARGRTHPATDSGNGGEVSSVMQAQLASAQATVALAAQVVADATSGSCATEEKAAAPRPAAAGAPEAPWWGLSTGSEGHMCPTTEDMELADFERGARALRAPPTSPVPGVWATPARQSLSREEAADVPRVRAQLAAAKSTPHGISPAQHALAAARRGLPSTCEARSRCAGGHANTPQRTQRARPNTTNDRTSSSPRHLHHAEPQSSPPRHLQGQLAPQDTQRAPPPSPRIPSHAFRPISTQWHASGPTLSSTYTPAPNGKKAAAVLGWDAEFAESAEARAPDDLRTLQRRLEMVSLVVEPSFAPHAPSRTESQWDATSLERRALALRMRTRSNMSPPLDRDSLICEGTKFEAATQRHFRSLALAKDEGMTSRDLP